MSDDTPQGPLGGGIRQFTVDAEDDGIRLDRWFKRHLPDTNFNQVSRWARTGQLRVDGARAKENDRVSTGQVLRVPPAEMETPSRPKPRRAPLTPEQEALAQGMVIHKDAAALVLNKPPGLATQGGTGTYDHVDRLLDGLCYDLEGKPKLVHRLDKDTSGALLVARTARAAAYFSKSFSGRTARKIYWALVVGVPDIDDGIIDLPLGKQPGTGGEKMQVDEEEGQPARTRYRVLERAGNRAAWVELHPHTGRTHQLRVHMAAIGHPIVGDGKYGGPEAFLTGGVSRKMHLHARRIRIDHPDGGKLDITAELPAHFAESMKMMAFDMALGDAHPVDDGPLPPTREQQKAAARAHAKNYRKERRGERRGRGDEAAPKRPASAGSKKSAGAKPGGKSGPAKSGPAKAGPARSGPAKPGASRGPSGGSSSRGGSAGSGPARGGPAGRGPRGGASGGRPAGGAPRGRPKG